MKKLMFAACAAMACAVFADKVTLKSGSVLTGKILGTEGDVIKFESEDFGVVDVKPEAVAKLVDESAKPVAVAAVQPVPKAPETWHGSVNASFNAARGNTYDNTWGIIANLNRRWDKDRLNVDFGYHYSEKGQGDKDAQKSEDRWEIEAKHDHFWWEKVYSYEDLRYDRDMIQDLSARYRVGLGGGYQWLENTEAFDVGKFSFNQELGVNYIKEEYDIPNDDVADGGYCALRYAHHFSWLPKWREGLEFFHNAEYLPQIDDWDKFLVKADVGFSTKLIYDFDLLCKIEWDFNSKPANDRKRDDVRYIVGLGYKW